METHSPVDTARKDRSAFYFKFSIISIPDLMYVEKVFSN
jgi:hypothetical protein